MRFMFICFVLILGQLSTLALAADPSLDMSYRRVLPLEAGSNFRDAGDYPTLDGTRVVRGKLFRSAAMYAIESENDLNYLNQFQFKTVLDLRSQEERELQPDRWVFADERIEYVAHEYSFMQMMQEIEALQKEGGTFDMPTMYKGMHNSLKPQLKLYFDALLQEQVPIVLHCSAGQDRTGFISAMVLSALNVERSFILEDYQLSTDFRRPGVEKGDIDYKEAAQQGNLFAKVMLEYTQGIEYSQGNPLRTEDGTSFLSFAFDAIEAQYGSVNNYLQKGIGLDETKIAKLKALYTE